MSNRFPAQIRILPPSLRGFLKTPMILRAALLGTAALLGACNDKDNKGGGAASAGRLALSSATFAVGEAGPTATITVNRSGGSNGAASVRFATSNGTATAGADYTATSGTLNWANGDAAPKTFTVAITNDTAVESAETVNLTLTTVTGATLGTQTTAVLTINDNDSTLAFSAATFAVGEAGPTATISVTRTGSTTQAASVSFASSNGTATAGADYTAAAGTLNWAVGDGAAKSFTVAITEDFAVEPGETVNLALSAPTGATLGAQTTAVLTINDNDVVTLSGTAATGAPLIGALVQVKDAAGTLRTATTDAAGDFGIATAGMTPPFLVRVTLGGVELFSAAPATGVVNITPYTNLIIEAYYQALGSSTAAAFADPGATGIPAAVDLGLLGSAVENVIAGFLTGAGLDPVQFDLFVTPFDANGTGFDGLLDDSTFSNDLDFTVASGGVTTVVDTTIDSSGADRGASFVSTTTDGSGNSSQASVEAEVVQPSERTDLTAAQQAVRTALQNLFALAAARGDNLTAGELLPFFDVAYLSDGDDENAAAAETAEFFTDELPNGASLALEGDPQVQDFTDAGAADTIRVTAKARVTPPAGPSFVIDLLDGEDGGETFRRQGDGSFRLFGNQRAAQARLQVEFARNYDNAIVIDRKRISAQANVTPGSVSAITVSSAANRLPQCSGGAEAGGDFDTERPLNQSMLTLEKRNGTFNGQDRFDLPCAFGFPAVQQYPPAGTVYTFAITPTGGAPANQTSTLRSNTTEPVDILTVNGQARATFDASATAANTRGTTLTLTWTRPDTFPVTGVEVRAFVRNAAQETSGGGEDINGPTLAPTATSGSIAIPAQVNGQDVTDVNVTVSYEGANGERTQASLQFP